MPRIEHKSIPAELKMAGDDRNRLAGNAAVMLNIDAGNDIIAPGAFKDAIGEPGSIFVGGLNHNWDQPIGRLREAREDGKSLYFESGDIVETTHGLDVKKLVNAGVINRASIGYKALEFKHLNKPDEVKSFWKSHGYTPDSTDLERAGNRPRLLTRLKLFEVSPVTIPMNDRASIAAVKSMFDYGMGGPMASDPDDLEDAIRDSVVRVIQEFQWRAVCAIVRNDMLGGDDRLALIGPVFDQAKAALLQYLKPLMGGEAAEDVMEDVADTLESMGKSLMARLPEAAHQYTVKALAPASGAGLDDYFPAVEPALRDFCARNRARLDIRLKEGRVLSSANVERMERMRDSLRSHADDLHAMVETARPRPKEKDGHAARSPFGGQPAGVVTTLTLGGKSAESAESDPHVSEPGESPAIEAKGVVPFADGPTTDGAWDGAAADVRVRKWAGGDDKDKVDWAKYAKAFAYIDADGVGSSFGAYHLQHHDVEGGVLKVHRAGLMAAANIMQGARGGAKFVEGLPAGAADGIKAHLGKHYKQFDMTAPWDRGEGKSADDADGAQSPPAFPDTAAEFAEFYATDPALTLAGLVAQR